VKDILKWNLDDLVLQIDALWKYMLAEGVHEVPETLVVALSVRYFELLVTPFMDKYPDFGGTVR
jgi:hypothetical protein